MSISIFHPWLENNNVSRPVLLFIDGHTSHLTLHTSQFYANNNIILASLLPNSTRLIQPMDVAVFRTLKSGWKVTIKNWRVVIMRNLVLKEVFQSFAETMYG